MRANYAVTAQEPRRATQTEKAGSMPLAERAALALRQGLQNGTPIEMLFRCAGETIAVLSEDAELRELVKNYNFGGKNSERNDS